MIQTDPERHKEIDQLQGDQLRKNLKRSYGRQTCESNMDGELSFAHTHALRHAHSRWFAGAGRRFR